MNPPDLAHLPVGNPLPKKRSWLGIWAVFAIGLGALLVLMRLLGLLIPYRTPTSAMAPAVAKDEAVVMEGFTYLFRKPRRGEIIVFETKGIEGIMNPPGVSSQNYIKRIAGEPGDRVRITGGRVNINDQPVTMRNKAGEIQYTVMRGAQFLESEDQTVTVPSDHYFVLGDNSPQSADSRFWGCVPAGNIKGKVAFH